MNDRAGHSRIPPPGADDDSLREYGRQLAIDSLLELTFGRREIASFASPDVRSPTPVLRAPAPRRRKWTGLVAASAAGLLIGVVTWWWMQRPIGHPVAPEVAKQAESPKVALAAGWRIEPTGKTVYRVLTPDRIRLDQGELLVESVGRDDPARHRPQLMVETPNGHAIAEGTRFFVGTHSLESPVVSFPKGSKMSPFTRVLVLAGVVTLVNAAGRITGQANHLLAAEPDKAPVNHAIKANSDFAIDLYRQLAKENPGKNLFFSPYSMSIALAMTAEGARGETAAQMGKVLRFPKAAERIGDDAQLIPWNTALIHTGLAELNDRFTTKPVPQELRDKLDAARKAVDESKRTVESLRTTKKMNDFLAAVENMRKREEKLYELSSQVDQYEICTANAIWGEKSYPFAKDYLETINKSYRTGGIFSVDFMNRHEVERAKINAWVEGQTNNRIKDLLPNGTINQDTRLVLTNAVYFKGDWQEPFAEADTKEADFTVSAEQKVRVPLMHKHGMKAVRYAAFDAEGRPFATPAGHPQDSTPVYPGKGGFQMAELPYKGGELAMLVLLPQDADGLAALEQKLSSDNLRAWTSKLESRTVNVSLPKFTLDTDYDLKETLRAMGMLRAFEAPSGNGGAQFDGMCADTDPAQRLYITAVMHKAFVEVNEKGTEAAAATAVVLIKTGKPAFIPTFHADKPFIYAIRDVKTGTILFLGRMTNPK